MGRLGEFIWAKHVPPWAKKGYGGPLMSTLMVVADVCADMMLRASQAGLISSPLSPDDVLGLVGKERGGLFKYPAESFDQFRARLLLARETWDVAGSDTAILGQLEAAGFPGCTIEVDLTREGPRGEPAPYRSQFWVRVPAALDVAVGPGPNWDEFDWDDGTNWGPGEFDNEKVKTILGIVNKFRDGQHVCRALIIECATANWDEFDWDDGTPWGGEFELELF